MARRTRADWVEPPSTVLLPRALMTGVTPSWSYTLAAGGAVVDIPATVLGPRRQPEPGPRGPSPATARRRPGLRRRAPRSARRMDDWRLVAQPGRRVRRAQARARPGRRTGPRAPTHGHARRTRRSTSPSRRVGHSG